MEIKITRVQKNNKNQTNKGVLLYFDYIRKIITNDNKAVVDTFKNNQVVGYEDKNSGEFKFFIDYQNTKYQNTNGEWKKNYDRFSAMIIDTNVDLEGGIETDKGEFEKAIIREALKSISEASFIFGNGQHTQQQNVMSFEQAAQQGGANNQQLQEPERDDINLEDIKF